MQKWGGRKPFVDPRHGPHDKRFELPDSFDRSTYLTKVPRGKQNIAFYKQKGRDTDLIEKRGNSLDMLDNRNGQIYKSENKDKLMTRLNQGSCSMGKSTSRDTAHISYFKRD